MRTQCLPCEPARERTTNDVAGWLLSAGCVVESVAYGATLAASPPAPTGRQRALPPRCCCQSSVEEGPIGGIAKLLQRNSEVIGNANPKQLKFCVRRSRDLDAFGHEIEPRFEGAERLFGLCGYYRFYLLWVFKSSLYCYHRSSEQHNDADDHPKNEFPAAPRFLLRVHPAVGDILHTASCVTQHADLLSLIGAG